MRIHEPRFPSDSALYIIWCEGRDTPRYSLAAGSLRAMEAAWEAVQQDCPRATLTLQERSRVLAMRGPVG